MDYAWMKSPDGEVKQIAVTELTPALVKGWRQCEPPSGRPAITTLDVPEETNEVNEDAS